MDNFQYNPIAGNLDIVGVSSEKLKQILSTLTEPLVFAGTVIVLDNGGQEANRIAVHSVNNELTFTSDIIPDETLLSAVKCDPGWVWVVVTGGLSHELGQLNVGDNILIVSPSDFYGLHAEVLTDIVPIGYQFIGVADPTTNDNDIDVNVKCAWFAATAGTYTGLGNVVVDDNEIAVITRVSSGGVASYTKTSLGKYVKTSDIVDDLETDDPTKVLSAKQGKVLGEEISQLEQEKTETPFTHLFTQKYALISGRGLRKSNGSAYDTESFSITDGFIPIEENTDLIVYGSQGDYITCLALYSSDSVEGFIEASDTAYKRYTADELTALGAKYFKACVNTEAYQMGYNYIAHLNYRRLSHTVSCGNLLYDGNKSVTIDTVILFTKNGPITYYADGDASSHQPKTFVFDTGTCLVLVINCQGNIVPRANLSKMRANDIVLLSKSSTGTFNGGLLYPMLLATVEQSDKAALESDISLIEGHINDEILVNNNDLSALDVEKGIIGSNNKWASSGGKCVFFPLSVGKQYKVTANDTQLGIIAVLAQEHWGPQATTPEWASGFTGRIVLQAGESYVFTAPEDAKTLYMRKSDNSDNDCLPYVYTNISDYVKKVDGEIGEIKSDLINLDGKSADTAENIPVSLDANGWEIPLSSGMAYALKKSEQQLLIPWTAVAAYPHRGSDTDYPAGEEVALPYSSVKELRKYINWEVSEKTFMTAVHNPYGLFYTENVAESYQKSGYGYTYHGVNCASYYGVVCSTFALWCLGLSVPWDTFMFSYLEKNRILAKVADQSSQGVHICDLVWKTGHCILVTGVQHDQYGNVTNIKITEAIGKCVRTVSYTASEFDTYLHVTNNCIIYRYLKIYDNKYLPSEFVGVRGETQPSAYVYNDDICFFAGDYAAWRLGDDCWLNYTKGNYTHVKIFKGNTLLNTIALDSDSSVHKIDVTLQINGAGKYKACLTDGTNDTDYTYWELVETAVSYNDGVVAFDSANGTPWWIQICAEDGHAFCFYEITPDEILAGEASPNFVTLIEEQEGIATGTTYMRVMFKGEYGAVVSQMLEVDLS